MRPPPSGKAEGQRGCGGLIVTRNLQKVYSGGGCAVEALRGVSLEVADGDFVAIVGPSGSGKSTLMNVLGCLDAASGGYYALDGEDVTRLGSDGLARVRSRKIGFVFQNFNLLPRLTALENAALPLMYLGVPLRERRERRDGRSSSSTSSSRVSAVSCASTAAGSTGSWKSRDVIGLPRRTASWPEGRDSTASNRRSSGVSSCVSATARRERRRTGRSSSSSSISIDARRERERTGRSS